MIPDIDYFTLRLVAYCHRHNIETGGHYLDPTNGWPVCLSRMSAAGPPIQPVDRPRYRL